MTTIEYLLKIMYGTDMNANSQSTRNDSTYDKEFTNHSLNASSIDGPSTIFEEAENILKNYEFIEKFLNMYLIKTNINQLQGNFVSSLNLIDAMLLSKIRFEVASLMEFFGKEAFNECHFQENDDSCRYKNNISMFVTARLSRFSIALQTIALIFQDIQRNLSITKNIDLIQSIRSSISTTYGDIITEDLMTVLIRNWVQEHFLYQIVSFFYSSAYGGFNKARNSESFIILQIGTNTVHYNEIDCMDKPTFKDICHLPSCNCIHIWRQYIAFEWNSFFQNVFYSNDNNDHTLNNPPPFLKPETRELILYFAGVLRLLYLLDHTVSMDELLHACRAKFSLPKDIKTIFSHRAYFGTSSSEKLQVLAQIVDCSTYVHLQIEDLCEQANNIMWGILDGPPINDNRHNVLTLDYTNRYSQLIVSLMAVRYILLNASIAQTLIFHYTFINGSSVLLPLKTNYYETEEYDEDNNHGFGILSEIQSNIIIENCIFDKRLLSKLLREWYITTLPIRQSMVFDLVEKRATREEEEEDIKPISYFQRLDTDFSFRIHKPVLDECNWTSMVLILCDYRYKNLYCPMPTEEFCYEDVHVPHLKIQLNNQTSKENECLITAKLYSGNSNKNTISFRSPLQTQPKCPGMLWDCNLDLIPSTSYYNITNLKEEHIVDIIILYDEILKEMQVILETRALGRLHFHIRLPCRLIELPHFTSLVGTVGWYIFDHSKDKCTVVALNPIISSITVQQNDTSNFTLCPQFSPEICLVLHTQCIKVYQDILYQMLLPLRNFQSTSANLIITLSKSERKKKLPFQKPCIILHEILILVILLDDYAQSVIETSFIVLLRMVEKCRQEKNIQGLISAIKTFTSVVENGCLFRGQSNLNPIVSEFFLTLSKLIELCDPSKQKATFGSLLHYKELSYNQKYLKNSIAHLLEALRSLTVQDNNLSADLLMTRLCMNAYYYYADENGKDETSSLERLEGNQHEKEVISTSLVSSSDSPMALSTNSSPNNKAVADQLSSLASQLRALCS